MGLSERQTMMLMEMGAGGRGVAIGEPELLASLADLGLVERLGERRARLTDRGAMVARDLIRAERGRGSVWDSPRARALVA